MQIFANARFRSQNLSGVQRYACELLSRLPAITEKSPVGWLKSGVASNLWEQIVLPYMTNDSLLWSPCNSGPLVHRRHAVTIHDMAFIDCKGTFSRRFESWYLWLIPQLIESAVVVLTVSEFSKQRICHHTKVNPDNVRVIYNGFSSLPYSDTAPEGLNCWRDKVRKPFFLIVGSMNPRKNLVTFLLAWNRFKAGKNSEFELFVVGGRSSAFKNVEIALDSSANFCGRLDDASLGYLYRHAHAVICPSLYEGFGLPVVEALGMGASVLCSDIPAFREVAGDFATYFDPLSVEEMVSALCATATSTSLQTATAATRTSAFEIAERYSWDRSALEVKNVLMEAAAKTG